MRVGRVNLRWWHFLLLGVVLGWLSILCAFIVYFSLVPPFHGMWDESEAYVSDSPALTTIKSRDRLRHAFEQVNNYFLASALDYHDALDLKIGYASQGTVLRFYLNQSNLDKLLAKKKHISDSAAKDPTTTIWWTASDTAGAEGWRGWYLHKPPFTKLTWWPPSPEEAARMSVYGDEITWRKSDFHAGPGAQYRILVNPSSRMVYIMGP